MDNVSELDVLLSQALGVAEIKKIRTKWRLFLNYYYLSVYMNDSEFIISRDIILDFEKNVWEI